MGHNISAPCVAYHHDQFIIVISIIEGRRAIVDTLLEGASLSNIYMFDTPKGRKGQKINKSQAQSNMACITLLFYNKAIYLSMCAKVNYNIEGLNGKKECRNLTSLIYPQLRMPFPLQSHSGGKSS